MTSAALDRTDAERWRDDRQRYYRYCRYFKGGLITEAVFKAYLHSLGFRGREIETEVSLHWPTPASLQEQLRMKLKEGR